MPADPGPYCEWCDLPLAFCVHGRAAATAPAVAGGVLHYDWAALWELACADELGPWIESRYHGICRACGSRWEPGAAIRWDEGERGYIGDCCGR